MKCLSCGAEITYSDLKCPYCGRDNDEAIQKSQEIDSYEKANEELKRRVISQSGAQICYKIQKRINIVLLAAFLISCVVGITVYCMKDTNVNGGRGDLSEARQLYEAGNLEELYYCLLDADALEKEGYEEYAKAGILWNQYRDCQDNFAKSLDDYSKKGKYDKFYIGQSVENGYRLLTNYVGLRYYTDEVSQKTKEMLEKYKADVVALFTGIFKIPAEKIAEFDKYSFSVEYDLEKYVQGELECEN